MAKYYFYNKFQFDDYNNSSNELNKPIQIEDEEIFYNPMEQFKNRNKNSDNEFIFDSNEKSTTNLGYF